MSSPNRHLFAIVLAACTFLLVVAGGLVTSTGSGLAVPDWPLSFGQVFPRMEGGVLFEHGHRLIASGVGLLTVIMAVWTARSEPRAAVRMLGWGMLAVVVVQGLLGGATVLLRLPDTVSVAHAGMAQVFFSLTVVMAVVTAPGFLERGGAAGGAAAGTRTLVLATVAAVYLQIILGAVVRHTGAGLAIPDFPLAFGRLIPPFETRLVAWNFAHRVGAIAVAAMVAWSAFSVMGRHRGDGWLTRPAIALLALVVVQILLGGVTIWTRRAVTPTTAHVAVGALLLVTSVLLAVRIGAAARPTPAGPVPGAEPEASLA